MDRETIARRVWMVLGLFLLAALALGFLVVGWIATEMPASQADRLRGPHGLVGVRANATYAWVVPSDDGVVLVDTGMDPEGKALLAEVGGRKVEAILLTHAHADHLMGLSAFPDAPVYVHPEDEKILKGEREPRGWVAGTLRRLAGDVGVPAHLVELTPDQDLEIDGARFHVVGVPGHTDGSVAFLWEDVLLSGDALWGGPPLMTAPAALADDPKAAEESLKKLVPLDFDTLADGHVGLTSGARAALLHLLELPPSDPTISVRSDDAGPRSHALTRTGVLVRAPAPDVRGEQPELVLADDPAEPAWRIATQPVPEHDALVGRRVVVKARRSLLVGGPGVPMDALSVEASPEGEQAPPPPTTLRGLAAWEGRWVRVSGTVRDFAPLEPGAAWGEGQLVLADGATVSLSAPVDEVTGAGPVDVTARVALGPAGPHLTVVDEPVTTP